MRTMHAFWGQPGKIFETGNVPENLDPFGGT